MKLHEVMVEAQCHARLYNMTAFDVKTISLSFQHLFEKNNPHISFVLGNVRVTVGTDTEFEDEIPF